MLRVGYACHIPIYVYKTCLRDLIHNNEKLDGISVDKYIISDLFVTESIVYNYCKQRVNDTYYNTKCATLFSSDADARSREAVRYYTIISLYN